MGVLTQSSLMASRRGLALPSAMFALVAIAVLLGGIFVFADLNAKTVRNRERAARAQHVAEAGVNHAVGLLRGSLKSRSFNQILKGSDGATGTALTQADDSLFIGYGLAPGDQIPLAGQTYQGHTYFVTVADDPADTDGNPKADMNGRVRIWCRGVTTDGATAEVQAIVGGIPQPGIVVDGDVSFGNSNTISGQCGGVHANGNMTSAGGGPTLSGPPTATGTVTGSYNGPPRVNGADAIPIPDLNPMNYCAGADFLLLPNGAGILNPATGLPIVLAGWTWDILTQSWKGQGSPTAPPPGTYCVQDDAWLAGSTGSAAAPKNITILASGSIKVDGQPFIRPDHEDGILLMAGGDLWLAGNNMTGIDSYQGLVYAGAQCTATGSAKMYGQLVCANGPQPAGAIEYGATNAVTGSFSLNFDCSATVFNKRRVLYWYPQVGT